MAAERPSWKVKYDGVCSKCGRTLRKGEPAVYERSTRTIRCIECPPLAEALGETAPLPQPAIDVGVAGASARREHERRHAKREARVKGRFGQRLGRVVLAVTDDPLSTRAWERGAAGEEELSEVLAGIDAIVALHDRRVPGTRGNIDHLVVAPAGVFVIDAKRYEGQIRVKDRGGLFRTDLRLTVGGRDVSKLADGLTWQVEPVRQALSGADPEGGVPLTSVLCFIGAEWPLLFPPSSFREVLLETPRTLAKRLVATRRLDAARIDAIGQGLARAFPSKS